jgi:CHAT domain-containing protein/tetratricopeptide (TPR) repeat protein
VSSQGRPSVTRAGLHLAAVVLLCPAIIAGPALRVRAAEQHGSDLRALIDEGRYARAEAAAEALVASSETTYGPDSFEAAQAIDFLVETLWLEGKGVTERARVLAERTIRIKTEQHATESLLVPSLLNLGNLRMQAAEYEQASPLFERALKITEAVRGPNHPETADCLDALALASLRRQQFKQARELIVRSLHIREAAPAEVAKTARTLDAAAQMYQQTGDYASARPLLERALRLRDRSGPSHPDRAWTLGLMGDQLLFEGDPEKAKDVYLQSLALAERTLSSEHPVLSVYLRNLAAADNRLGNLSEAIASNERGLAIAEKALGESHFEVAGQLNDLAERRLAEGNYEVARRLYERALALMEKRLGPDHVDVATEVFNLARVRADLGDMAEARRQHERAIGIWQRALGPDHPFVGISLVALADLLVEQRLWRQALPLYERALAIRQRSLGPDHPDVAEAAQQLASTLARLGKTTRARELSEHALAIWEKKAVDSPNFAAALASRADLLAELGEYEAARPLYERGLRMRARFLGREHPQYAEIQARLAVVYARLHQREAALAAALQAEQVGREHLRVTLRYLPEHQALSYAARRPTALPIALSLASTRVVDDAQAGLVFDALIRARASVLDEMAARRRGATGRMMPDVAPLWSALVAAQQRLANLAVHGPDARRPDQYLSLFDRARREKETAERALAERSATFKAELARTDIGLGQIRAALPAGSALISFVRFDRMPIDPTSGGPRTSAGLPLRTVPSYLAFVLHAGDLHPAVVPLGTTTTIDGLVARWRDQIVRGVVQPAEAQPSATRASQTAGTRLRQQLWDPLANQLKGVARVFVVPDGSLNLVAFDALPTVPAKYLIDEGPVIHYLSAERDLVAFAASVPAGRGLLAIGGPAFDAAPPARSSKQTSATRSVESGTRAPCGGLQSLRFGALPAARREADEVARLWNESAVENPGEESAQILGGPDASEARFKQQAPGRRILHLATHGFFLGAECRSPIERARGVGGLTGGPKNSPAAAVGENPLLLAGLALAGANRRSAARPNDEDGILIAEEVTALNLEGVEWAVLSACDTGLGEVRAGEGVFGLRRAFQIAGARTVIMSLWSVDDRAARLWMRALYEGRLRKRLSTADAMHEASLSMLRSRRAHGQRADPFYWAGFVAAGDWR